MRWLLHDALVILFISPLLAAGLMVRRTLNLSYLPSLFIHTSAGALPRPQGHDDAGLAQARGGDKAGGKGEARRG